MVRKLVERADVLVERSHSFAPLIKDTCNRLDSGFNDFFQKIMRINNKEVCLDNLNREKKKRNIFYLKEIDKEAGRKSDSSLEEKLEQQELNEGKRKAAKQRE